MLQRMKTNAKSLKNVLAAAKAKPTLTVVEESLSSSSSSLNEGGEMKEET